jgi:hypothetical protein
MIPVYLTGISIAFLIGIYKVLTNLATASSIRARNLSLIGFGFSPWAGTFIQASSTKWYSWLGFIVYALCFEPLFSWLIVLLFAWQMFSGWTNKVPIPEKIKELQYRIATSRESRAAMQQLSGDIAAFYGQPSPVFDADGELISDGLDEEQDELSIGDADWSDSISLDRKNKRYHRYCHPSDYMSVFHSDHEYRIEGVTVFTRLLEDKTDQMGQDTHYSVKDNVVLEHDIRQRHSKAFELRTIEEELQRYRDAVEWSEMHSGELKYFILHRSPDQVPLFEARRFFRQELQRLQAGIDGIIKGAAELGVSVNDDQGFLDFTFPATFPEEGTAAMHTLLSEESLRRLGISYHEFQRGKRCIAYLEALLSGNKVCHSRAQSLHAEAGQR